jgi:thiamine biosynthesis lipoprotein
LDKVRMDKVVVDRAARTVSFRKEGMLLDFGGIGKGWALDRAAEMLRQNQVTAAVLSAGTSSVVAIGAPPNEPGWKVRIRDPYNKDGYLDEVVLRDESLSTSGSYEKFFDLNGKKYCHIFDPHTGRPVEGMLSATAIAAIGVETDALSTAFFVMGEEKTRQYCRKHSGTRAILVPLASDASLRTVRIGCEAADRGETISRDEMKEENARRR